MSSEPVIVTGGSGLIGTAIITELQRAGYRPISLDRVPPADTHADVEYLIVDLLDAGAVFDVVSRYHPSAIIHMGTLPSPSHHPDHVTFESNVMTSYHILSAAAAHDVESVCLASSINAVGYSYQDVPMDVRYLPVDEEHPRTPRDAYALGKAMTEDLCDGIARQAGTPTTLATLRFPAVLDDEALRSRYADANRSLQAVQNAWDPDGPSNDLFAYIHVNDAARIARQAIEADFDGHETFWAVAKDTTADVPTETLIETFHPEVPVNTPLNGYQSLISTEKAAQLLDWEPIRSWRH